MALFTKTPVRPSYLDGLGYHAALLAGVCGICGMLILMSLTATKDRIEQELINDKRKMLEQIIPSSVFDNQITQDVLIIESELSDSLEVNIGLKNGSVSAVAFQSQADGYGGAIKVILGINPKGELLGVRVISHAETPGLGDKIEINKDDWITSFDGKSLENLTLEQWAVKKDGGEFDQFTGATITPRAVVQAVYLGLQQFKLHKQTILSYEPANEVSNNE